MGTISFSGLASGLDTTSIVSSLVSVAKIPMNQIQKSQSTLTSQSKKISDIKTQLTTLQTAAKALDTKQEALSNKVSSSTESVLTATAQGGSSMGTFKVDVTSLAQSERTYSNTVASDSTPGVVTSGPLSIKVGPGTAFSVEVNADDTLASIAKKINASGAEVSAGVFHDGTTYRLQVTANKSGEANSIEFGGPAGDQLGLTDPANEKQKAADAVITIDGLQVKSATNTITGAVPGVTLSVSNVGSSTVKVDRDGDGLSAKLTTFVNAYNAVMKTLNTEFSTVSGTTKSADSLSGDPTMRNLQTSLRSLASKVIGSNQTDKYSTFGSIGVTSGRDGTLTLDTAKFNKAVSSDYDGVASLLAGRTDGSGIMSAFSTSLDNYTKSAGTLDTRISGIAARNKAYDQQLAQMQTRLDKYEQGLNDQFTALESTMSDLKNQGNALSSILSSS